MARASDPMPRAASRRGRRVPRWRRWGELGTAGRLWVVGQVIIQAVLRGIVATFALVLALSIDLTSGVFEGDSTGKHGTAVVRSCEPVGLLPFGISIRHTCRATLHWQDGTAATTSLTVLGLGPGDAGARIPVAERMGSDKWGRSFTYVEVNTPWSYTAFGWALLVSVGLVTAAFPAWLRRRDAEQRAQRRLARRYRARPGLVIAAGYWLIFTGGFGSPADPPQPGLGEWGPVTWPPWSLLLAGHAVLVTGLVLARRRALNGYPPPPRRPLSFSRVARAGVGGLLVIVAGASILGVLVAFAFEPHVAFAVWCVRLAIPAVLLLTGVRMLVLWLRQRSLPKPNGTAEDVPRSAEPTACSEPSY